jgi:hypothetical protein
VPGVVIDVPACRRRTRLIGGARHTYTLLVTPSAADHGHEIGRSRRSTRAWFVILPPGENAAPAPANVSIWNDTAFNDTASNENRGGLYHQLGVTERALVVVRPDGYIGYRAQPADGAKLLAYLDKYLIRT